MISRRRFNEWLAALAEEKRTAGRLPWLTFIQSLFGGVVPRRVWRARMQTCLGCAFLDHDGMICRSKLPFYKGDGCRCYTVYLALAPDAHHDGGCYAFVRFHGEMGWPAYPMGRRERWFSPIRFLLRR